MSKPDVLSARSSDTNDLSPPSPGAGINDRSHPARSDREVRVWDTASAECRLILGEHRSYIRSVAFSQSQNWLLSGSGDGVVRLWELATGTLLQRFDGHRDGVYHAVFDASETRVLSGGRDRSIRLWDLRTGR